MSCCGVPGTFDDQAKTSKASQKRLIRETLKRSAVEMSDGRLLYTLTLPDIHCGACVQLIEKHLRKLKNVTDGRVNLTQKRVSYCLTSDDEDPNRVLDALVELGYTPTLYMGNDERGAETRAQKRLLMDLAVAGFAMMNIMLLSVSVWSGAEGVTRDFFHLVSGMIAVPAVLFSGQSFFSSAIKALRAGYLNMDVPISLAVLLALTMSIYESVYGGRDAYFEASTMLLFFLLIGRYLDRLMREKAKNIIARLKDIAPAGVEIKGDDGQPLYMSTDELRPGMVMQIHPGTRLPVDGVILRGQTEIDRSLVTGESMPVALSENEHLESGVLNLSRFIEVEVVNSADRSFLAGIIRMIEESENSASRFVGIAERMVRLYAPAVHLLALVAFVLWAFLTGGDYHTAINIAIAVLIITCPCALGLAVPMVQITAASRLFQDGTVLKDGAGIEKLDEVDHVIFDKTGTLTTGQPVARLRDELGDEIKSLMLGLARTSSHPASKAIAKLTQGYPQLKITQIEEIPGKGIKGIYRRGEVRLGKAAWVAEISKSEKTGSRFFGDVCFARAGQKCHHITIEETLRDGAIQMVERLRASGISVEILSGDRLDRVKQIALKLGIKDYAGDLTPQDKMNLLHKRDRRGEKVLMIGDGLNDAPSLAVCHVSMAPGSASDVSRLTADFVFMRDSLSAVTRCLSIAKHANKLIKQNFALAFLYNVIAVPIAFAGYVTPLVAAISMSLSSIIVVANSLRLYNTKEKAEKTGRKSGEPLKARTA